MKRRKLATAVAAIVVSIALPFMASGAAVAASDKPASLEKTYKHYKPFPEECYSAPTANEDTCIILYQEPDRSRTQH